MNEKKAKLRAEVILKVRTGQITAKEGAKILGVSRKTYYQWEKRGLEGMMEALLAKPAGRKPKETDQEKENLRRAVKDLSQENITLRTNLRIKEVLTDGDTNGSAAGKTEKKD